MLTELREGGWAARHANREDGQPARTNQAAADDSSSRPIQYITNAAGGSGRQIPVGISKGSRAQIAAASLKRAHFWPHIKKMELKINMRLETLSGEEAVRQSQCAEYLLSSGLGTAGSLPLMTWVMTLIQMPEDMLCPRQNLESLTAAIYGDLQQHHADSQYLIERAIRL
ncbi:MAG: hypothetical protein FRX49_11261 [Trebouxia sp. A1-2]|nr:MAG: hypothetical protein FRX49_11261 [Trebouxia sp. A1-2]